MFYTDFQREAMRYVGLAKVHYKEMWNKSKMLGYVTPGSPNDNIYIAKDFPNEKVRKIALLHECGHIKYNHTSVNMRKEIKYIKSLFKKLGKPLTRIRAYGDITSFINICMDLEVNSKLLTLSNVKYMTENNFPICTAESFGVDVMDEFREYYIPLIEKLPDEDKEFEDFCEQMQKMVDELIKDISSKQKGKGQGSQSKGKGSSKGNSKGNNSSGKGEDGEGNEEDKNKSSGSGNGNEEDDNDSEGSGDGDEEDDDEGEDESSGFGDEDEEDGEDDGNVNEAVREDENSDSVEGFDGTHGPAGKGHIKKSNLDVQDNCSSVVKAFFRKIVGSQMVYLPDSLKHYNRGTRRNSEGFLYSSIRRRNKTDKKRVVIILDSSGSMDSTSVLSALGSIKQSLSVLANDSCVLVWDTNLCEEFPITKVPSQVSAGGGTDMAAALRYAIEEKKADAVCMYSDFETSISPMIDLLKKNHIDMYSIAVSNSYSCNKNTYSPGWGSSKDEWDKYISLNKDWILVG